MRAYEHDVADSVVQNLQDVTNSLPCADIRLCLVLFWRCDGLAHALLNHTRRRSCAISCGGAESYNSLIARGTKDVYMYAHTYQTVNT